MCFRVLRKQAVPGQVESDNNLTERPGPADSEAATPSQARRLGTIIRATRTRNSANLKCRLEGRGPRACRLGEPEQARVRVDSEDTEGEGPRHGGRGCAAV
jgi:hypothetical protein